jgi:hypothetical protein
MDTKKQKKEFRVNAKIFHITLENLSNPDKVYWLEIAKEFRINPQGVLVGIEENQEEGKGVHAHIVMQFTTRQNLVRQQFVKHFGTDAIHISSPKTKKDMVTILGYASKTGNTAIWGEFTYKNVAIDINPVVARFNYQVDDIDSALQYFEKVIEENLVSETRVINQYALRKDDIGRWLRKHPSHRRTLEEAEAAWRLKYRNENKKPFSFHEWMDEREELERRYKLYLAQFPAIFEEHKPVAKNEEPIILERDFADHVKHDLDILEEIAFHLKLALKYGSKRPHKSLNLYVWSHAPSFGKTRLLKFLDAHMVTYLLPADQYYVTYNNDIYDLLVSDEAAAFLKSKDYSHLKLALEGQPVEFNIKGKTKVVKVDNPLMFLTENVPLREVMERFFPGRFQPAIMATRILDLELRSRASLHFFIDYCFKESKGKPLEELPMFAAKR